MKISFFAVLLIGLVGICESVFAGWVMINSNPGKGEKHYFDPTTVRNSGDHYKKVWILSSYNEKQRGGYQSLKTFYEFDCESERARSYTMLLYSDVMAMGNTIGAHHDELKEWFQYPASSFFKRVSTTICNQ